MTLGLDVKARDYGIFFEQISPSTIEKVRPLVTEDVRFKDPFNDVRGVDNLLKILGKMFDAANDINFTMRECAGDGLIYFLRWKFSCRPKSRFLNSPWEVDGISVISFTETGLIREHIDYWDAAGQLYEHLPLIGGLLRLVRRPLVLRD